MFKKLLKNSQLIAVTIAAMVGVLVPVAAPLSVSANSKDAACTGFNEVLGDSCDSGAGEEEINSTLVTAIDILSMVVGIISVIMIIIAGMKYITASGDPGSIKGARNTVIYALVGLAIVALSQTIVKFVVREVVNNGGGTPTGNNALPN